MIPAQRHDYNVKGIRLAFESVEIFFLYLRMLNSQHDFFYQDGA